MTVSREEGRLYVAQQGDDRNPGTEAEPLATLSRARDAVRELKKRVQKPINVLVRGGVYYLRETLVFTPQDSGTEAYPVTYAAYPAEKPVISGGMLLKVQWETYRDGIMKASVPAGLDFDQLFVNGRRMSSWRPTALPGTPGSSSTTFLKSSTLQRSGTWIRKRASSTTCRPRA